MEFHVRVVEATNVPNLDVIGKSDPFCVVKSNAFDTEYKTKVIENSTSPLWNAEFSLTVKDVNSDVVTISIFDKDDVSTDDLIASMDFPISQFQGKGVVEKWYNLNPAEGIKGGCKLRVVFHLAPIGTPRFV